jgi:quercetin dioxygenase-like cupin family protein
LIPVELAPRRPSAKGPEQWFTGDVWFDPIASGRDGSGLGVNAVHFSPGARTAWHVHSRGQTLYVTDGQGYVQSRDDEVVAIRAGDVVFTPADEWHWHGAAHDHLLTHISITEGGVEWGDHVGDDEYPSD